MNENKRYLHGIAVVTSLFGTQYNNIPIRWISTVVSTGHSAQQKIPGSVKK